MHLICKYQYYDTFNYIVDKCEHKKGTVGTEEFKLVKGDIDIEGGAKDEEIKINYIAFDNKRKTPFNYLLHGVLYNKSNDKTNVLNEFTKDLIKKTIIEHRRIIFNGNGYSDEWVKEAEKRGLLNIKSTPEAIPLLSLWN